MGCMFVLICGRNPGACCHECDVECFHECSLDKTECDFYDNSGDSVNCADVDCVCSRKE